MTATLLIYFVLGSSKRVAELQRSEAAATTCMAVAVTCIGGALVAALLRSGYRKVMEFCTDYGCKRRQRYGVYLSSGCPSCGRLVERCLQGSVYFEADHASVTSDDRLVLLRKGAGHLVVLVTDGSLWTTTCLVEITTTSIAKVPISLVALEVIGSAGGSSR